MKSGDLVRYVNPFDPEILNLPEGTLGTVIKEGGTMQAVGEEPQKLFTVRFLNYYQDVVLNETHIEPV